MFKFYLPFYEKNILNNYSEFNILSKQTDKTPTGIGIPMPHQELIGNFLRGVSPVEGLLLVHDMGTGKTCTAIQAIENNIHDEVYGMKKGLILNKGKAIMTNFINELVNKCTTNYSSDSNKKLWSTFYTFSTFEIFAKKISKLTDEYIKDHYNNTFLVIDEVHNILNEQGNVYSEIYRFINLIENKKILLLSGTPVKDVPENFVPIINLLLKPEERINIKTFKDVYYDKKGNLTENFKEKIRNKVSYLKSSKPEIPIVEKGSVALELKKFKVISHTMREFQSKIYRKAFKLDEQGLGIYNNSRQASRMVFPDGSYGTEGFDKYVNLKKMTLNQELKQYLISSGTDLESILDRIGNLSILYEHKIRAIIKADSKQEKTLMYDDLVKGSGIIVFALLLKFCKFTKFRLITAETTTNSTISRIQKQFNEDVLGEDISVILGSKVIAEGFTFKDVLHEHVVPHWNNTETLQVLARGIRMGSHENILKIKKNAKVSTYRHVVFPIKNLEISIDYIMTKTSETKELEINKILSAIEENSITCRQFSDRNETLDCIATELNPQISDNVISTGKVNYKIVNKINDFFMSMTCATLDHLVDKLNIPKIHIIKTFEFLISNKISFTNNYGVKCYYNFYYDIFFVIDSINSEKDFLLSYYTKQIKPFVQHEQLYKEAVSHGFKNIDDHRNTQRLLELAVTIKMFDLSVPDIQKVEDLLDTYKNYWEITEEGGFVWFLHDFSAKDNPMCLYLPNSSQNPWSYWKPCNKKFNDTLFEKRFADLQNFEDNLQKKNINYYGTVNPETQDFCVKNIVEVTGKDKRKISGGKRCLNWKKAELLEIARDELGLKRDWNNWISKTREYICDDIKNSFEKENLIRENKYCGTQNKKH